MRYVPCHGQGKKSNTALDPIDERLTNADSGTERVGLIDFDSELKGSDAAQDSIFIPRLRVA